MKHNEGEGLLYLLAFTLCVGLLAILIITVESIISKYKRRKIKKYIEEQLKKTQHEVSTVKCDLCSKEWVAVRPPGLDTLECPNCKNMVRFENVHK